MERRWCRLAPTVGGSLASRSSPAANSSGGQARGRGDDTRSRQLDVERGVYRSHQLSDSHSSSAHGRRSPFCWHEPYSPAAAAVTPTASPRDRKSAVCGQSVSARVDLGGRRTIKKEKN